MRPRVGLTIITAWRLAWYPDRPWRHLGLRKPLQASRAGLDYFLSLRVKSRSASLPFLIVWS